MPRVLFIVLLCVAAYCSMLQCIAFAQCPVVDLSNVLFEILAKAQCVAVCDSVLKSVCVAVCVAVCCNNVAAGV